MNHEKYQRNVILQCPTCGCCDFSYDEGVDESIQLMICASCERELTREELIHENSENIHKHVSEIKKDIADEIRNSLKKAFSSSKNFRIK